MLALFHVERRFSQCVVNKFQPRQLIVRRDWEDRMEGGFQTLNLALRRYHFVLQELLVGLNLSRQHVRHVQYHPALRKALANAFFLGE